MASACPPPAGSSAPQLYWAYASQATPIAYRRPTMLCGAGFQPGEQVTLRITGVPTRQDSETATADTQGAFSTTFAVGVTQACVDGGLSGAVEAQGAQGGAARVALPRAPEINCQ